METLLQFIKENFVPPDLESIEEAVSKVLLEKLLKQIKESDGYITSWEKFFYMQFLFEPNTDIESSTLEEYYTRLLLTDEGYIEKVEEFSRLVLETGINTENMKKLFFERRKFIWKSKKMIYSIEKETEEKIC